MQLVRPSSEHLSSYIAALERGWSPNTLAPEARFGELAQIERDATAFLELQVNREAKGGPVQLPDGSFGARLPGYKKWMWDGEFCGSISFRWQPGTTDLPPHCLGHIGFSVVPWKRRRGYATRALALILPEAKQEGITFVEVTTDVDNIASQRVITANGGRLVERFHKPAAYGGGESLRYRIDLL
jgi:predicted acetyltransferase